MAIRVWQMYFVEKEESLVQAARQILRVMPAKGDRCLPSELWKILAKTDAWTEMRERGFNTSQSSFEGGQSELKAVHKVSSLQRRSACPCCRRASQPSAQRCDSGNSA